MTQMGLDYLKHVENQRHNQASEEVDRRNATVNERNASSNEANVIVNQRNATSNEKNAESNRISADAKAYEASFADDKVAIQQQQANAQDTANDIKNRQVILDHLIKTKQNTLKDRELDIKEFDAATNRYKAALAELPSADAALVAQEIANINSGSSFKQGISSMSAWVENLLKQIRVKAG